MHRRSRPLSPHIQIYRPQITSVLSITHRATGIALAAGLLLLVYWLVALASGPQGYSNAQAVLGSWFGRIALLGFTLAFFFHLSNGIRHLFWDSGRGFELSTVYASGKATIAATVVLTLIAWGIAYIVRGA